MEDTDRVCDAVKTDPRRDDRLPSLEPPARPVPVYDRSQKKPDPLPTRALAFAAGVATTLGMVSLVVPLNTLVAAGSTSNLTPSETDAPSQPGVAEADVIESAAPSPSPAASAKAKAKAKASHKTSHKTTTTHKSKATSKSRAKVHVAAAPRTKAVAPKPRATPRPVVKPAPKPKPKPTPVSTGASGKP